MSDYLSGLAMTVKSYRGYIGLTSHSCIFSIFAPLSNGKDSQVLTEYDRCVGNLYLQAPVVTL